MRSYDVSTRTDLPIPFAALSDLVEHLRDRGVRFVLIGATARDLMACGVGGLPITRATVDVDVAVAVTFPDGYGSIGDLQPHPTPPRHDFRGLPVDVVPFGEVEEQRHVLFPDDHRLDVTGVAEACKHAVDVRLPGGAVAPVASLESQSILKLLAWRDRGTTSARKDALDLATLFMASRSGVYEDSLWEDPALEAEEYDIDLAGAHRLGREAADTLGGQARSAVLATLATTELRDRLARAMGRPLAPALVEAYLRGFREQR